MTESFSFFPWPEAISDHAAEVDTLAVSFILLTVALALPVFVVMLWFGIRYRRGSPADRSHRSHGNPILELSWMVIPFVLTLFFFGWAAAMYRRLHEPPSDALTVHGIAKQWMWKFEHPGGQREINRLHVPAGRAVRVVLVSQDAIHSFFVPALRIKQDVLPGRYTQTWFKAEKPGRYLLECAEYCGALHSVMRGRIVVLAPERYQEWLQRRGATTSLAAEGRRLYRTAGCSGCHEPGGTVRAPSLRGVFGRQVPLSSGGFVTADRAYLRDSILLPKKHVVAGYEPVMPSFQGKLSEGEIARLIAFIQSLGDAQPKR